MTTAPSQPPSPTAEAPATGPGAANRRPSLQRRWWLLGLAVAVIVVVLAAAFASPDPDGLERVAEDHGFLDRAEAALFEVIPDYAMPGIDDPILATIAAGILGLLVVFAVVAGLGRLLQRHSA